MIKSNFKVSFFTLKKFFSGIALLALILLFSCTGAEYYVYNIKVDKIYEVEGMSKNQIFNRTLKWVSLNVGWSNSVIDYKDSTVGTMIVKLKISTYDYNDIVYVPCVFEFNMKDNKTNIKISNYDEVHVFRKDDRNGFRDKLNLLCEDYNKYLRKSDDF